MVNEELLEGIINRYHIKKLANKYNSLDDDDHASAINVLKDKLERHKDEVYDHKDKLEHVKSKIEDFHNNENPTILDKLKHFNNVEKYERYRNHIKVHTSHINNINDALAHHEKHLGHQEKAYHIAQAIKKMMH